MRIFDEKGLVDKLEKILRKEFGTNLAFREFSAGYGIADLVFAPNFSFTKNLLQRTPLTSFDSLRLLFLFEMDRCYQMDDILEMSYQLTENEVKRHLRQLIDDKYILKLSNNTYCRNKSEFSFNPIKKIIAIEAKLSDHNGGLTQAKRYQYFADESYLAILKESERNIDFDEFNKHNIGLILFDSLTSTIEIKQPTKVNSNYKDMFNLFAKEMMLSKFINVSF